MGEPMVRTSAALRAIDRYRVGVGAVAVRADITESASDAILRRCQLDGPDLRLERVGPLCNVLGQLFAEVCPEISGSSSSSSFLIGADDKVTFADLIARDAQCFLRIELAQD
jgi:hypothetical protein